MLNLITSYLWNIWNELGVSKGLVVSHVGIKTSCIYQEGLNTTQICLFLNYCVVLRVSYEAQGACYLVFLSTQSNCCGDLLQLCRRLFPEDPLQQDKNVCRLWRSLQQHCQTTIPGTKFLPFGQ